MTRDRLQTEQRLLSAVHEVVTTSGFSELKINQLARTAKVNKILIYRYFGGLQGLISAYYEKYQLTEKVPPIDLERLKEATVEEFFDTCCMYFLNAVRILRHNPQTLELVRNHLTEGSPMPDRIQQQIVEFQQVVVLVSDLIQTRHGRVFVTILGAGLTQLLSVAHGNRQVMGIDVSTDEGWNTIEEGVRQIFYCASVATQQRLGSHVPTR